MFLLDLAYEDLILGLVCFSGHGRCYMDLGTIDFSYGFSLQNLSDEVSYLLHFFDSQFHMGSLGPGINVYQGSLNHFTPIVDGMLDDIDIYYPPSGCVSSNPFRTYLPNL